MSPDYDNLKRTWPQWREHHQHFVWLPIRKEYRCIVTHWQIIWKCFLALYVNTFTINKCFFFTKEKTDQPSQLPQVPNRPSVQLLSMKIMCSQHQVYDGLTLNIWPLGYSWRIVFIMSYIGGDLWPKSSPFSRLSPVTCRFVVELLASLCLRFMPALNYCSQ